MKDIGKMIYVMVKVHIGYAQAKINIENYIQVIGKIIKEKDSKKKRYLSPSFRKGHISQEKIEEDSDDGIFVIKGTCDIFS